MTRTFNFNGDCRTYTVEKEIKIKDPWSIYRFSRVKELRDCICEITNRNTGEEYAMVMHEQQIKEGFPSVYELLIAERR